MLQMSGAVDKIWKGSFKIDMCFSYGDDAKGKDRAQKRDEFEQEM